MPPHTQPKIYQTLIKSHKLTALTTVAPSTSVAVLKAEVLDALKDDVTSALEDELPPRLTQTCDFELCRALKDTCGRLTGEYELLVVAGHGGSELGGAVFAVSGCGDGGVVGLPSFFRELISSCLTRTGDLRPVEYVPYEDDDDAPPAPAPASAPSVAAATAETSTSRGKRKARPD